MKKLLKLFVLILTIIVNTNYGFAAVKVMPTLIELNANKSKGNYLTTSFFVQADKNETIRFKLYPEYFTITDEGKMSAVPVCANNDNLIPHARFVPNEFTLKNTGLYAIKCIFAVYESSILSLSMSWPVPALNRRSRSSTVIPWRSCPDTSRTMLP